MVNTNQIIYNQINNLRQFHRLHESIYFHAYASHQYSCHFFYAHEIWWLHWTTDSHSPWTVIHHIWQTSCSTFVLQMKFVCIAHLRVCVRVFFSLVPSFPNIDSFIYLFRLSYFAIPTIFKKYHFQGCMWLNHRSNACLYLLSSFLFTLFLLSRFSVFIFVIRWQTKSNMIITIGSHCCETKRIE